MQFSINEMVKQNLISEYFVWLKGTEPSWSYEDPVYSHVNEKYMTGVSGES